ncbi:MAG: amidohydrolase [Anaerolineales bacterium]|nr:amidohydrolase [Anaerolineales bacterium]
MDVDRSVLERARAIAPQLVKVRRKIHRQPEYGFQEYETMKLVASVLDQHGISYQSGVAKTGLIAEIGDGKPTIALRADMDALPITERTGLSFASNVPGMMHACGHDAHTAALLGAAILLSRMELPPGTVRFLFQPAEETADEEGKSGAVRMVEAGAMVNVDAVVGVHNIVDRPPGTVLVSPGPILAATDMFELVVYGKASHGAYPHRGVDAIVLAAQIVNAIQSIVARRINPMEAGVVTVGTVSGGRKANIIADRVELTGTLRCFDGNVRQQIIKGLEEACGLAKWQGGDYELTIHKGHPPTINDRRMSELVSQVAQGLGFDVGEEKPSPVSEDFSLYSSLAPGVYFLVGAALDDGRPMRFAHNAEFDLDERFLPISAAMFAQVAQQYLLQEQLVKCAEPLVPVEISE